MFSTRPNAEGSVVSTEKNITTYNPLSTVVGRQGNLEQGKICIDCHGHRLIITSRRFKLLDAAF